VQLSRNQVVHQHEVLFTALLGRSQQLPATCAGLLLCDTLGRRLLQLLNTAKDKHNKLTEAGTHVLIKNLGSGCVFSLCAIFVGLPPCDFPHCCQVLNEAKCSPHAS
jgi:hypothetical protein